MPTPLVKPRWKKGESGNPAGRPRKFVCTLKGIGYKLHEINDTIQNMIGMDHEQLSEISKDKKCTILESIVAGALLQAEKKKSLYNIETLLTRVYGRPGDAKPQETEEKKPEIVSTNAIDAAREYSELMK